MEPNVLFRLYLDGDENAFAELIKLLREPLIFFVMRFVQSLSLAEEIAEDAFVELLIHKERFNFSSSIKTYLFTIARNKAINYIRRNSRLTDDECLKDAEADTQSLEERVIKSDEAKALYKVLDRLNEDYRKALWLVYVEDMSYTEAGRVLGKSTKQIENIVYRAKNAARKELEKEGIVHEDGTRIY